MNLKGISFYLGLFLFPIVFLSFINILYASYFDYFLSIEAYLITLSVSLISAVGLYVYGRKAIKKIDFIEQLILIILVYFFVGFLISIPYYFNNFQISFVNAFFESISGLTATGFTIFENIKYLDPTLILWRSSSQWIGGLYFLIFLTLLFSNKTFNFKMTNLTFPGDSNFNSTENIKNHLLKLFIFYTSLSFIFLLLLSIADVRLFNSVNLGMTLISGGGFLPTDNLSNIISTNSQKIVLMLMFFLSITNFYLIFNFFNRRVLLKSHKEDMYLFVLIIIFTLLILFNDLDIFNLTISILSALANSGVRYSWYDCEIVVCASGISSASNKRSVKAIISISNLSKIAITALSSCIDSAVSRWTGLT